MGKTAEIGDKVKQGDIKASQGVPPGAHRFQPGQSGNPAGRPKSRPMAAALKAALSKNNSKSLNAIVDKAVEAAESGDYRYAREIFDRVDGKVADKIEHSGHIDSVSQEEYEVMNDERQARLLRTAGVADVLAPSDGENTGEMDTSEV